MALTDKLKDILSLQKEVITNLESEIASFEANDFIVENDHLKSELARHQAALGKEKADNERLLEENKKLKNALYEHLYNEKTALLNSSDRKMQVYFKGRVEGEANRLLIFENAMKRQIYQIESTLKANRIDAENEIYKKLAELKAQLNTKVTLAREEYASQTGAFGNRRAEEFEKLRQEQVTEDEIKGKVKQNNLESLIGLNVLNKLGVLLLVIGVIALSRFTYFRLPDMLKGILAFAAGGLMLVFGEILNRKKPNVFSLGITSGGIAVLYVALVFSYFGLKILGMYAALGLCVMVTSCAFVLSQRYNSQTISAFAMIGGYLPLLSINGNDFLVYGAMVYFVILNLLALSISVNKKWMITAFVGFVLNVSGSLYILSLMFSRMYHNKSFGFDDIITLLYIAFVFVIYTMIPVMSTYRKKLHFKKSDIVLMALNTVISTIFMYAAFYEANLSDFTGILAIAFACVYLALGSFIEKRMAKEEKVKALFYLTGLVFVVLIIPFQFGETWLSLGWLVEGVALLSYGIYKEEKVFAKFGTAICALCLAAFMLFDVTDAGNGLFGYKYFAMTAGSVIILAILINKRRLAGRLVSLFKYGTLINLWFYTLYFVEDRIGRVIHTAFADSRISEDYLLFVMMIAASFILAYAIPRVKILCDKVVKMISAFIYIISLLAAFLLNYDSPVNGRILDMPAVAGVMGTLILTVFAVLSILALRDLLLNLVIDRRLGVQWYPLVISGYAVIILTQNLITQYGLEFNNALISIIYVVTAFAWITFGFVKKYAFIRRFGLGLSILAVAKLFLLDLSFLSQGYRIVSYFAFGVTLIAISFVYQYFSKRIELIGEVLPNDEKAAD